MRKGLVDINYGFNFTNKSEISLSLHLQGFQYQLKYIKDTTLGMKTLRNFRLFSVFLPYQIEFSSADTVRGLISKSLLLVFIHKQVDFL